MVVEDIEVLNRLPETRKIIIKYKIVNIVFKLNINKHVLFVFEVIITNINFFAILIHTDYYPSRKDSRL